VLNSSIAIILTAMVDRFDLSNREIALGAMAYSLAASLTQPLFGLLADRLRGRWLGAIGLTWTMVFFGAAAFATTYPAMLGLLVIGALGSGAFHPVGAMSAAHAGGSKASSATSIFFLLGQSGLALGPVISGFVLQRYGTAGLPFVAAAMAPAVILMVLYLRQPIYADEGAVAERLTSAPASGQRQRRAVQAGGLALTAFLLLIILRATTQQTFMALLPKYLADQGFTPDQYGAMMGFFNMAGAIGTFAGGLLGDRMNRRRLIFWAMLAAAPLSYAMLGATGPTFFALAPLAGFALGLPHSILVVMAQRLLPKRQGLASGAVLGLMFASGAVASGAVGWISDFTGLGTALYGVALLPSLAGLCALTLPATRTPQVLPPAASSA
jgi:FSR family fosmidomycin resistance protein-like MFS transporter